MKRIVVVIVLAAAVQLGYSEGRAANFDQITPLAAPADGNNFLFIDDTQPPGDNTFVSVNTGVTIGIGSTYRITAATGYANGEALATQSIQMWTGSGGGATNEDFIGQGHTGGGPWVDAPEGEWVDNFFEATVNDFTLGGKDLIILVTNFGLDGGGAIAYWDNFRVTENGNPVFSDSFEGVALSPGGETEVDDPGIGWFLGNSSHENSGVAAGVPEPASVALLSLGSLLLLTRMRRRTV